MSKKQSKYDCASMVVIKNMYKEDIVRGTCRRPQFYTSMRLQPDKGSVLNVLDENGNQVMRAELANAVVTKIASRLLYTIKDAKCGLGNVYGFVHARTQEYYGPRKLVTKYILVAMVEEELSPRKAESEALLAAMADADPVASAVIVNLLYTLTNPRMHIKLKAELQAHEFTASTDNNLPSYQTFRTLPYLSAVVRESFRILPSCVGTMEKQLPAQDNYTTDGRFVPSSTIIGPKILAILCDCLIFDEDECWLKASTDEKMAMDRSVVLCFSTGCYTCLEKKGAILDIHKTVVELVRRLDISIVDQWRPCDIVTFGLFLQDGMWMTFEDRRIV
ncbi:MAG: hypothetical protein Q9166_001113 [cf. Caloplaca sp. 2 TL-2023]